MSESVRRYEADKTEWDRIAETREFKDLLAIKKTFIIPAFLFFIVYYFLLPILVGYAPNSCRPRLLAWSTSHTSLRSRNSSWRGRWRGCMSKQPTNFDRLAKDIIKEAESQVQGDRRSGKCRRHW